MLAIEPVGLDSAEEELRTVGARPSIGHGENTWAQWQAWRGGFVKAVQGRRARQDPLDAIGHIRVNNAVSEVFDAGYVVFVEYINEIIIRNLIFRRHLQRVFAREKASGCGTHWHAKRPGHTTE